MMHRAAGHLFGVPWDGTMRDDSAGGTPLKVKQVAGQTGQYEGEKRAAWKICEGENVV